jgi:XTP/dITP diphosphohydrolase
MIIWFATNNAHKQQELEAVLPGHSLKIPAQGGMAFDPAETGGSFLENALIKARALRRLLAEREGGLPVGPVIADDSGLCVDALGGAPGIYSARYAGKNQAGGGGGAAGGAAGGETGVKTGGKLSAAERNLLLLEELGGASQRSARFVCAMVLLYGEDRFFAGPEPLAGEIRRERRGGGGFGYDPLLYIPARGCTAAELSMEQHNRVSHRGKAGRALARFLEAGETGETESGL